MLAFLYILIVGFIYELKEGALNIVKKAHSSEIKIINKLLIIYLLFIKSFIYKCIYK